MLEILVMLTLFVRPIYSFVLLVLNQDAASGHLSLIYVVVALLDYLYVAGHYVFRKSVKGKFWVFLGILIVILGCMSITGLRYNGFEGDFLSSLLSYASLSVAAFLLGVVLVQKDDFRALGKVLPVFFSILTIVSLEYVLKTMGCWDGLWLSSLSNDINYQNCTYYAAYALGLNLLYLLYYDEFFPDRVARSLKWVFYIEIPVEIFTTLTAGGRGGFLLAVFLMVYFIVLYIHKNRGKAGAYVVGAVVLILIGGTLGVYLAKNGNSIRGFYRIIRFLNDPGDSGREYLYEKALSYFLQSPLVGNGIGSIWFTVGFYSHNVFFDLLCETGIVGTSLFLAVLAAFAVRAHKMIRRSSAYRFGVIIFLFVFAMLFFSGYYLTEPMLWFAVAYMYGWTDPNKKRTVSDHQIACKMED